MEIRILTKKFMETLLRDRIKTQFKDAIYESSDIYIRMFGVEDFLAWCDKNDIAVIGIEGFELYEHTLKPSLDLIADFSPFTLGNKKWSVLRKELNQGARLFFKNTESLLTKDSVFNFVLKENYSR